MYAAIKILEKAYLDSGAMQASPEATTYRNQIELAIKILKKHTEKLEKEIEKELLKETA